MAEDVGYSLTPKGAVYAWRVVDSFKQGKNHVEIFDELFPHYPELTDQEKTEMIQILIFMANETGVQF